MTNLGNTESRTPLNAESETISSKTISKNESHYKSLLKLAAVLGGARILISILRHILDISIMIIFSFMAVLYLASK
ncbi:hypothetical protein AYI69_g7241 [Smittium culicis]|uniref:Uncharacterized protein n=1 Tax=Smittium culicis TaxID=133412 RepID=A0A1R1XTG8_9FUNG|nr:hypothetical protein AYI69_g7241 [Smittium culicis]